MKRTIAILAVITLTVLVLSSSAFAFGGGFGGGSQSGTCLRLSPDLSEAQQNQFDRIITEFKENMAQVREKLVAARNNGNKEELESVRAERDELMEEKRNDLAEFLPDEFTDRFQNCGKGMRNFGATKGGNF